MLRLVIKLRDGRPAQCGLRSMEGIQLQGRSLTLLAVTLECVRPPGPDRRALCSRMRCFVSEKALMNLGARRLELRRPEAALWPGKLPPDKRIGSIWEMLGDTVG